MAFMFLPSWQFFADCLVGQDTLPHYRYNFGNSAKKYSHAVVNKMSESLQTECRQNLVTTFKHLEY